MFRSSGSSLVTSACALLQQQWTPWVNQIRTRYWSTRPTTLRHWGYNDNFSWRGALPRIPSGRPLVGLPPYAPKHAWAEKKALFGQNDYIDILGDGSIHPVKISYAVPDWLKGFKGNEFQMLIRKRKHVGHKISSANPVAYHNLHKRIKFLNKVFNWRKPTLFEPKR